LDAHLGEIFRSVPEATPLSADALKSVGRRIARDRRRARRSALRNLPLVFAVLVGGAGASFAQLARPGFWHLGRYFASHAAAPVPDVRTSAVPSAPVVENVPAIVDAPPGPVETPPIEVTRRAPAAPDRRVAPGPTAQAFLNASPPPPNPIALESECLQKALAKLRRDHDAAAALPLLDEYAARFPRGQLLVEASVARVDALLLLDRKGDALTLLAQLPLDGVGRSTELHLLRAELYAERECARAIPDFDAVLRASPASPWAERALYGRAACRLRLGDTARAQDDLETYLSRYPSGRFADRVRARLQSP
jgi:hypothetical protein